MNELVQGALGIFFIVGCVYACQVASSLVLDAALMTGKIEDTGFVRHAGYGL